MKISFEWGNQTWKFDTEAGIDISIPLEFNGAQPNTYGVPKATAQAYRDGSFVGDTREGGGCNFETYTLTPHCNGTHTEGIGHLTRERIPVSLPANQSFLPACLISIKPCLPENSSDTYTPQFQAHDLLITREAIEQALNSIAGWQNCAAIIIRTLPNLPSKKSRDYMQEAPAFFTHEAMHFLASQAFSHLLTDIPSLDRLFDEGLLSNHHIWWNLVSPNAPIQESHALRTVTEMIFAANEVVDGLYVLNLQIAPFLGDATPSRPLVFPILPV
jgi:kynurenine formamidase